MLSFQAGLLNKFKKKQERLTKTRLLVLAEVYFFRVCEAWSLEIISETCIQYRVLFWNI